MRRPRGTLALRISILATAVALITAVVGGVIAAGLIRQANLAAARQALGRVADAVQADVNSATAPARARAEVRALKIATATISEDGKVTSANRYARDALTQTEISKVVHGGSVSAQRTVDGAPLLIAARPTRTGGVVLVQHHSDALAVGDQAVRRLILALAIAVGIAILLGLLVAWRLARPLRRTAAAAHALAGGRRDIAVPPQGPAEVAEVADALNTLAAGLALSEGRQRDFLMSVSHDLRTPLTAINGYAESLADGVVAPEATQRVGEVMLAESQRLERLVADLLDLARLGSQDFRVDPAWIDVGEVVGSAGEVWAARCAAEGVRFGLECPPGPLIAYTDPLRLRQVLDGLLENALRVTPAGAPIVLAARPEPGCVVAEVRDGGPGLADEDLAVAFERSALYERYRGVRRVGTGLGLAIVHGLVTRTGGTIEAGHAPEGGARFTVRMPVGG